VQTYGTARSTCSDSHNPENIALIAELKITVDDKKQKIPSLTSPQIDTQPIDEYSIENVFAQATHGCFLVGKGTLRRNVVTNYHWPENGRKLF